jgi:predicted acylesterase/phospholipase RssA
MLMVLIAFVEHFGWDTYDDYLIKRPWERVLDFNPETIFNSYKNVGIFGTESLDKIISPLLNALDLPLNTTLQQLYEFSPIELHFYATDLKKFEIVDFSHKTHPDWKLLDVIYCSCALPILFKPFKHADCYYADGGIFCHYPIKQCVNMVEDPDEIFGINKLCESFEADISAEHYNNLVDYLSAMFNKAIAKLCYEIVHVKNEIAVNDEFTSAKQVYNSIKTKEARTAKIQLGVDVWKEFSRKNGLMSSATP